MFQLIVAVIGIALVVILAIIAIWVGGNAFTTSGEKALFTTYFNQGTQIEGALKLYTANNGGISLVVPGVNSTDSVEVKTAAALTYLVNNDYLTHAPDKGEWLLVGDTIYRALENSDQCGRLNQFAGKDIASLPAGMDGCPPCLDSDPINPDPAWQAATYAGWPGCKKPD